MKRAFSNVFLGVLVLLVFGGAFGRVEPRKRRHLFFDKFYALLLWPKTVEEAEKRFVRQCVGYLSMSPVLRKHARLGKTSMAFAVLGDAESKALYDAGEDPKGLVLGDVEDYASEVEAILKEAEVLVKKSDVANYVSEKVWPDVHWLTKVLWLGNKKRFSRRVERYVAVTEACEHSAKKIQERVKWSLRPVSSFFWGVVMAPPLATPSLWVAAFLLGAATTQEVARHVFHRRGLVNYLDTIVDAFLRLNIFLGVHLLYLVVAISSSLILSKGASKVAFFALYQIEITVYGLFLLRFGRDAIIAAKRTLTLFVESLWVFWRARRLLRSRLRDLRRLRERLGHEIPRAEEGEERQMREAFPLREERQMREAFGAPLNVLRRSLMDLALALAIFTLRVCLGLILGYGLGVAYGFFARAFPKSITPTLFETSINIFLLFHYIFAERRQINEWRILLTRDLPTLMKRRLIFRRKVPQKTPQPGDLCPICLGEFHDTPEEPIDFCKWGCGQPVHANCFQSWSKDKRHTCVFCQTWWG